MTDVILGSDVGDPVSEADDYPLLSLPCPARGRTEGTMQPPIIELSGGPREQGRIHGEALEPVIREILGEVLIRDTWEAAKVEWLFTTVQRNLADLAPEVLEEMRGIAEGCHMPFEDILAYNAIADIWMVHKFCTTTGWADCPGGPVIGKTNDIGRDHEKYHHPFRRKSGAGGAAVWATWPGSVWANCFINERGLAFGGASLGMDVRNEEGIPSNCMFRVLMDRAGTVEEALGVCDAVPVMHHPAHLILADAAGTLVAMELTPLGTFVCQGPGERYVRATNHFCPGPWEGQDNGEERHVQNSKRRFANLGRLAEKLPHTVEGMLQVIQDHAESGGVCQHGDADMWSSTGYVAVVSERTILIGRGQPCEAEYFELGL